MKKIADISNLNGNVDVKLLFNLGYVGIIAKASEGGTFVDKYYKQNYTNTKARGKITGAYHFANFTTVAKAQQEANFFLSCIAGTTPDFVVLDLEQQCTGDITDACLAFLNIVAKKFRCVVYCNPSFIKEHLNSKICAYPLWIANYGVATPAFTLWTKYAMWQFTEKGQVSGISGYIDFSYITDEFIKYIKGEDEVENLVVYNDGADQRAAEYLADRLACPTINNARKFDYSNVKNVYAVGGNKEQYTSYLKTLITGSNRYATMQAVLDYIKNLK